MALSPHTLAQSRLYQAVASADVPRIDQALAAGARLNEPLAVQELVELGYPVNEFEGMASKSVLQLALDRQPERSHLLYHLLSQGAQVQASDAGSLLGQAIASRQVDSVRLLLNAGADVNTRDEQGHTPLRHAVDQAPELVGVLVAHGARVLLADEQGHTPLHAVAASLDLSPGRRQQVLSTLLRHGAAVGAFQSLADHEGRTPAQLLAETDPELAVALNHQHAQRVQERPAVVGMPVWSREEMAKALQGATPALGTGLGARLRERAQVREEALAASEAAVPDRSPRWSP